MGSSLLKMHDYAAHVFLMKCLFWSINNMISESGKKPFPIWESMCFQIEYAHSNSAEEIPRLCKDTSDFDPKRSRKKGLEGSLPLLSQF